MYNTSCKLEGGLRAKGLFNKDSKRDKPLVSIITIVLNGEKYLEQMIQSVVNQIYDNIEYIVIDGGSTDGTLDIIRKYEDKIAYWISEKDEGMYDAINKGLKTASGTIFAYLNSDDLYLPNTVQTVVEYLQSHPDTSLIYGDCNFIDSEGRFLYIYHYPAFEWDRFIVLNWSSIPQQATFWRRDIHKKIGYFNPEFRMAGDFEFYARVGKHFQIDHLKKVLATYRLHKESLSSTWQDKNEEEVERIHQRYGISNGFVTIWLQFLAELQVKLLNLPLMIKKLLRFQRIVF